MQSLPKLVIILGPTASGKTKLAVNLANKFNAEIVSADSRQIYKNMNIGTNKNLSEYKIDYAIYPERRRQEESKDPVFNNINTKINRLSKSPRDKIKNYKSIPYHLINITTPNKQFTLAKYQQLAIKKINNIIKKNKLPILVGGTGLYISSILDNYQIPTIAPNQKIRQKLKKLSLLQKINQLKKLDPASLKIIDLKNPRRVDRALEICLTNYKFSTIPKKNNLLYQTLIIGIKINKEKLIKKINQRVNLMLQQGLIEETQKIITKYGQESQPLATIGYTEIINYLNKKITLAEAIQLIKIHTRQYAKRQITWFKRIENIHWITTQSQANKLIKNFLDN